MGLISLVSSSARREGQEDPNDDADEETWARLGLAPLLATLFLPIIIGVILLIKCVFNSCCFRKSTTKEEMYGVEGRMTMLSNADVAYATEATSNPNHLSSQNRSSSPLTAATSLLNAKSHKLVEPPLEKFKSPQVLINNNSNITQPTEYYLASPADPSQLHPPVMCVDSDLTDTLKRATGKRQLPDLPQIPLELSGHPPRRSSSGLSQDGTSELYATVGDIPSAGSMSGIMNPYAHLINRQLLANDASIPKPSTSHGSKAESGKLKVQGKSTSEPTPSSDSETYATSNHPYAKLKRNTSEHPYARVRNSNLGNDEETDTDNYDLPQPYAQTRNTRPGGIPLNSPPNDNQAGASSHGSSTGPMDGPVPPRRIGRQWRRGSHPQGQNNDTASHFSGDSQDSRGYTSISVREPLSNIRSQLNTTRNADSHYATVSDDSEEMYAAIDDSIEGNYMQIPDGDGQMRPSWLGSANVASPIPERREANSPLPPVPAVPPPEVPSSLVAPPPLSPSVTNQIQSSLPVYAQVTKKSKKMKAPVTPTASNASTSSQNHGNATDTSIESSLAGPSQGAPSITTHHGHHHRSKSRTLMDNSNLLEASIAEPRRWSKADISYSEFEVVREGIIPPEPHITFTSPLVKSSEIPEKVLLSTRNSIVSMKSLTEELVDEDNYNVIPDKLEEKRYSSDDKQRSHARTKALAEKIYTVDSDNYQEIEPVSYTYQEIGGGKEPSDHYQEIGSHRLLQVNGGNDDDFSESGLYQEIVKKEEYEDDEEDELYEKVKPAFAHSSNLTVPENSSRNKKHGYEKLKRKQPPPVKVKVQTSDEEEEDDEDSKLDEDDCMYERVRYPPYERLKESRSDLAVDESVNDEEGNNLYEHIGYSKVKKKRKHEKEQVNEDKAFNKSESVQHREMTTDLEAVDVNQLYAVVDKTKKKKHSSVSNNNNLPVDENLKMTEKSNISPTGTKTTKSLRSSSRNSEIAITAGADLSLDFIDDTIDIEYI